MTRTPLFLIWAIKKDCQVRESFASDQRDLLYLERMLRPLRCLAVATAEQRTIDDLCILQDAKKDKEKKDPDKLENTKGFSVPEVLSSFGGEEFLEKSCRGCVANLYRSFDKIGQRQENPERQFAGCYGYCQSHYDNLDLFSEWDALLHSPVGKKQFRDEFRLHHLWHAEELGPRGELNAEQKKNFLKLLIWSKKQGQHNADIESFTTAIDTAIDFHLDVLIQVIPAGVSDGLKWSLPQHCSNCIEPLQDWIGQCPRCGSNSTPNPARKRHLRGDRPYFPLKNSLGAKRALEIVNRYFV